MVLLLCVACIMASVTGIQQKSALRQKLLATTKVPFSLQPAIALPLPSGDVFDRYCSVEPQGAPKLIFSASKFLQVKDTPASPDLSDISPLQLVYGSCEDDSTCHSDRPFCVDGVCRECRGDGFEYTDCGPTGSICNEATSFTCSSCAGDNDCRSSTFCRSVSMGSQTLFKMPRKQCVPCSTIPPFAEVISSASCDWRCPIDEYYVSATEDDEASCQSCPQCSAGQFYTSPAIQKTSFYSSCTNATDLVCHDCESIGIDSGNSTFCAKILSPSETQSDSLSIGDLGPSFPCRFFECKEGWFLDRVIGKCNKCHFTMCPSGQFLSGCESVSSGACSACPNKLPRGAQWIDATDSKYTLTGGIDACQFTCLPGSVFDADENACVRCDLSLPQHIGLDGACNDGQLYTNVHDGDE